MPTVYLMAILMLTIIQLMNAYNGSKDASEQLSEILNSGYDKRIRPFVNEKPVNVTVQVKMSSLGPISEADFTLSVHVFFRMWWIDPRLNLTRGSVTFSGNPADLIWIPDLHFLNAMETKIKETAQKTIRTKISKGGQVYTSMRIYLTCTCVMDLKMYPFDKQKCPVYIESFAFSENDLRPIWSSSPVVYQELELSTPGYNVRDISVGRHVKNSSLGEFWPILALYFYVDRVVISYALHAIIPSALLVVMTWASFWIPASAYPARIAIIVTNFLACLVVYEGVGQRVPQVDYVTSLEAFVIANDMFIVLAMLEYMVVLHVRKSHWRKVKNECDNEEQHYQSRSHWIDVWSRAIFPIVYAAFITTYIFMMHDT